MAVVSPSLSKSSSLLSRTSTLVECDTFARFALVERDAKAAGVPQVSPEQFLSRQRQRKLPKIVADPAQAFAYLQSKRQTKKWSLLTKNTSFGWEEVLLGVRSAIEEGKHTGLVEALIRQFESCDTSEIQRNDGSFANAKGEWIPNLEDVFMHTDVSDTWQLFFGRVSDQVVESRFRNVLQEHTGNLDLIRELLRWGCDPSTCPEEVLDIFTNGIHELMILLAIAPKWDHTECLDIALDHAVISGNIDAVSLLAHRGADPNFDSGRAIVSCISTFRRDILLAILTNAAGVQRKTLDFAVGKLDEFTIDRRGQFLEILLLAGARGPETYKLASTVFSQPAGSSTVADIMLKNVSALSTNHDFPFVECFQYAVKARNSGLIAQLLSRPSTAQRLRLVKEEAHLAVMNEFDRKHPGLIPEVVSALRNAKISGNHLVAMILKGCKVLRDMQSRKLVDPAVMHEYAESLVVAIGNISDNDKGILCRDTPDAWRYAIEARSDRVLMALIGDVKPPLERLEYALKILENSLLASDTIRFKLESLLLSTAQKCNYHVADERLISILSTQDSNSQLKVKPLLPFISLDYSHGKALCTALASKNWEIAGLLLTQKANLSTKSLISVWEVGRASFLEGVRDPKFEEARASKQIHILKVLIPINRNLAPLNDLITKACSSRHSDRVARWYVNCLLEEKCPINAIALQTAAKRRTPNLFNDLLRKRPPAESLLSTSLYILKTLGIKGKARRQRLRAIIESTADREVKLKIIEESLAVVSSENPSDGEFIDYLLKHDNIKIAQPANLLDKAIRDDDLSMVKTLLQATYEKSALNEAFELAYSRAQNPCARRGCVCDQVATLLLSEMDPGPWARQYFYNAVESRDLPLARTFAPFLTDSKTMTRSDIVSEAMTEILACGDWMHADQALLTFLYQIGGRSTSLVDTFMEAAKVFDLERVKTLSSFITEQQDLDRALQASLEHAYVWTTSQGQHVVSLLIQKGANPQDIGRLYVDAARDWRCNALEVLRSTIQNRSIFDEALSAFDRTVRLHNVANALPILHVLLQAAESGRSRYLPRTARFALSASSIETIELLLAHSHERDTLASELLQAGCFKHKHDFWSAPARLKILDLLVKERPAMPIMQAAAMSMAQAENIPALGKLKQDDRWSELADNLVRDLCDKSEILYDELRSVLSFCVQTNISSESMTKLALKVAENFDLGLMQVILEHTPAKERAVRSALNGVSKCRGNWMRIEKAIGFVDILLPYRPATWSLNALYIAAAQALSFDALQMLASHHCTPQLASIALDNVSRSLESESLSPAILAIVNFLLHQGADGPAVAEIASLYTAAADLQSLQVLFENTSQPLVSPCMHSFLKNYNTPLTLEQIKVLEYLSLKTSLETSIEEAVLVSIQLLDIPAIAALSKSPAFVKVCDSALTILLETGKLLDVQGLEIAKLLLCHGAEGSVVSRCAFTAASSLDEVATNLFLQVDQASVTDAAVEGLVATNGRWLAPTGLALMNSLIGRGPSEEVLRLAITEAAQRNHGQAILLLGSAIRSTDTVNSVFQEMVATGSEWAEDLSLIQAFLDRDPSPKVLEDAFCRAAAARKLPAVQLLGSKFSESNIYCKAFASAWSDTDDYVQSLSLLEYLLQNGARGPTVARALIHAGSILNLPAVQMLSAYVADSDVYELTFQGLIKNAMWREGRHRNLVEFLLGKNICGPGVSSALVLAAEHLDVGLVHLLAASVKEQGAFNQAFEAITRSPEWMEDTYTSLLRILLERGAAGPENLSPNYSSRNSVDEAFLSASSFASLEHVRLLRPFVASVRIIGQAFVSVLDAYTTSPQPPDALKCMRYLLNQGISPSLTSQALLECASRFDLDAVKLLALHVVENSTFRDALWHITRSNSSNPHSWVSDDNIALVDFLLMHSEPDQSFRRDLGEILCIAIGHCQTDRNMPRAMLMHLLDYEPDVNVCNGRALVLAIELCDLVLLRRLLQQAVSATTLGTAMRECLHVQNPNDITQAIVELLHQSWDIGENNYLPQGEDTTIFLAIKHYGQVPAIIEHLCELGYHKCGFHSDDLSPGVIELVGPLHFAIHIGACDAVIALLLEHGSDFDKALSQSKATPLILAAQHDMSSAIYQLLQRGASVSRKDIHDNSALYYASRTSNAQVIEALLSGKPGRDDGSLHEATRTLNHRIIPILLKAGHNVSFPSQKHNGRSALDELCLKGDSSDDNFERTLDLLLDGPWPHKSTHKRTKPPIFYALENTQPVLALSKLIKATWTTYEQAENILKIEDRVYSPTMLIKKNQLHQPPEICAELLAMLEQFDMLDVYYNPDERGEQPDDAKGTPPHIRDAQNKKWLRSIKIAEEDEDHRRRLDYENQIANQKLALADNENVRQLRQQQALSSQKSSEEAKHYRMLREYHQFEHTQGMLQNQVLQQRLDLNQADRRNHLEFMDQQRSILYSQQQAQGDLYQAQNARYAQWRVSTEQRIADVRAEDIRRLNELENVQTRQRISAARTFSQIEEEKQDNATANAQRRMEIGREQQRTDIMAVRQTQQAITTGLQSRVEASVKYAQAQTEAIQRQQYALTLGAQYRAQAQGQVPGGTTQRRIGM